MTRDPLDPTRKFSEGGGLDHRQALAIDCRECGHKAGQWCALPTGASWAVCSVRVDDGRNPVVLVLVAEIRRLRALLNPAPADPATCVHFSTSMWVDGHAQCFDCDAELTESSPPTPTP